ncbi:MAG: hypothetical protein AAGG51_15380 [Cyanobacteria bacterium P01_G01_bin.54]
MRNKQIDEHSETQRNNERVENAKKKGLIKKLVVISCSLSSAVLFMVGILLEDNPRTVAMKSLILSSIGSAIPVCILPIVNYFLISDLLEIEKGEQAALCAEATCNSLEIRLTEMESNLTEMLDIYRAELTEIAKLMVKSKGQDVPPASAPIGLKGLFESLNRGN